MLHSCLPLGFSKATWSLSPWVCSASKTETPGPQLDSKDSPASCLHAHRVEAGGQGSPLHLRVTPSKPGAHGVSAEPRASQGWPSNLAHTCAWVTGQPGYGPVCRRVLTTVHRSPSPLQTASDPGRERKIRAPPISWAPWGMAEVQGKAGGFSGGWGTQTRPMQPP